MTEEVDVLVCVKQDAEHVEMSELDVCRECGAQIWVSPTGRTMQREKDLKIICVDCMPDPRTEDVKFGPVSREQLREIARHLRHRDG